MTESPPARLRLGMVGGGRGAFIGETHRIAARLDDRYELIAGALSADPQRAIESGRDLRLDPTRCYTDYREMAEAEAARKDGIDVVSIVTPNVSHHAICKSKSVLRGELFSINLVPKQRMFLRQAIYVLGPLQLRCPATIELRLR